MAETYNGFGVPNTIAPHHFLVKIPKERAEPVTFWEEFGAEGIASGERKLCRVMIPRATWRAVAEPAKQYLNRRLREKGLKASRFATGDTPVDRLLGREIAVLGWAIEGLDPERAALAAAKWATYRPEELWWIFAQVDREGGEFDGPKVGWRIALPHIFTGVGISETGKRKPKPRPAVDTPDLFSAMGAQA